MCLATREKSSYPAQVGLLSIVPRATTPPEPVAPQLDGLPVPAQEFLDEIARDDPEGILPGTAWGAVLDWDEDANRSAIVVQRLAFRFAGFDEEASNGAAQDLFEGIDAWFQALAPWVRTLVDQDADTAASGGSVRVLGQGMEVRTVTRSTVSPPLESRRRLMVRFPPDQKPLDKKSWRYALARVDAAEQPPLEYLLVSNARIDLHLSRTRRAVLDAATAVELALNAILVSHPTAANTSPKMLGKLVQTLDNAGSLPTGVQAATLTTQLINIRNRTVHNGYVPSHGEADAAVRIAVQVVEAAVPLPHGGP